jgi:hypothetical protein
MPVKTADQASAAGRSQRYGAGFRGTRAGRRLPDRLGAGALAVGLAAAWAEGGKAAVIVAGPTDHPAKIAALKPGDTLNLTAGTYPPLSLANLRGTAAAGIAIQGPATGPPAVVSVHPGRPGCCDLVRLDNAERLSIRNLRLDSAGWAGVDGVNAKGSTHHILIEGCVFVGQDGNQQTVAISTKGPAWNWTIRRNTILGAGTGMYFGDSSGNFPFIGGMIEGNYVADTIGYNIQAKWQRPYALPPGLEAKPRATVIRDNVLIKSEPQDRLPPGRRDGARPNLLVGGFPDSGPGALDFYEIYGNFLYDNRDGEALFQGSGRIAFHDNLLVGGESMAAVFRDHDLPLRVAYVFNNTVYAHGGGISIAGAPEGSLAAGNLVFADRGIAAPVQRDNAVDSLAAAPAYVNSPSLEPERMDFYPKAGGPAQGGPLDLGRFAGHAGYDRDFNGMPKGEGWHRGAYAGAGINPGWRPSRAPKALFAPPRK